MTPQEKNVFGKLFTKTKLGTPKVELGAVQDFDKMTNDFFKKSQVFESSVQKVEQSIKGMQGSFIELQKKSSELDAMYQKLKKQALDLGVSLPNEIENNYKISIASLSNDLATFKKYNK